jgi:hypothetical protein
MKIPFLLLGLGLSLATARPAAAQTLPNGAASVPSAPCGAFSGRVTSSSKPLSGASVLVKGTNIILITNEEGFFTLPPKVVQFPTLAISAAGYAPQDLTLSSCAPLEVDMQILPGTRIKKHGKRKGFIMKTGQ